LVKSSDINSRPHLCIASGILQCSDSTPLSRITRHRMIGKEGNRIKVDYWNTNLIWDLKQIANMKAIHCSIKEYFILFQKQTTIVT